MFFVVKPFVASTFVAGSLVVAFLCQAGPAFSQEPSLPDGLSDWLDLHTLPNKEMDAGDVSGASAGGSSGLFSPPSGRASCGGSSFGLDFRGIRSMTLHLETTFALEEGTSPGLTYSISHTRREGRSFAYLCIVHHQYVGEESDEFPYQMNVCDNTGEIEQLLRIGESSFTIAYKIVVDRDQRAKLDESLKICEMPVDVENGRVFIVNMSSEPAVVRQVDYPLPTKLSSSGYDKKAREVLDHLSTSGIPDDIKSRQVVLPARPAVK